MTTQYPVCKTVRYELETWNQIEIAAAMFNLTTSEYIRTVVRNTVVRNTVSRIDPKQVLPEEAMA